MEKKKTCQLQQQLFDRERKYSTNAQITYVAPEMIHKQFKTYYDVKVIGKSIFFVENGIYRKESENEVAARTYVILVGEMDRVRFFEDDSCFECVRELLLKDPELQFDSGAYYLVPIDGEHFYCAKRIQGINYDLILSPDSVSKVASKPIDSNYNEVKKFVESNFEKTTDGSFYASQWGYNLYVKSGGSLSRNTFYRHFIPAIFDIFGDVVEMQKRVTDDDGIRRAKRGVLGIVERKR